MNWSRNQNESPQFVIIMLYSLVTFIHAHLAQFFSFSYYCKYIVNSGHLLAGIYITVILITKLTHFDRYYEALQFYIIISKAHVVHCFVFDVYI